MLTGSSPFFAPYGFSVGDLSVPAGGDDSAGPIFLNQSFVLFGRKENEAYVCHSLCMIKIQHYKAFVVIN